MDSFWWYIGAGTTVGSIQLVLGIAIGLWMRKGSGEVASRGKSDIRRAKEFATGLNTLTKDVARDVDEHKSRIDAINGKLDTARIANDGDLTDLVVGVVGELTRANQELQVQLSKAESELQRQSSEIETHITQAMTDELTGVPNRRAFEDALQGRIRAWRHQRVPFTLMMLDIDHFKQVNDVYGHVAGDQVLKTMSNAVRTALRKPDLLCRFGGEEFVVLLPYTTLEDSVVAARKTLTAVEDSITRFEDKELRITTSIGLASVKDGEDGTELLKRADTALYASKSNGRNCGHTHDGLKCSRITALPTEETSTIRPATSQVQETPDLSPEMQAICEDLRTRASELADTPVNEPSIIATSK